MAKKKDYIPKNRAARLIHHNNLKNQAAALVGQAGITATAATNLANDNLLYNNAVNDVAAAEAVKQGKVATLEAIEITVIANERAFANRTKADVDYTIAIGQQLDIIGVEDTTDLTNAAPTLRLAIITMADGTLAVEVGFNKSISEGVVIFSRRAGETEFTKLSSDSHSPYVDNRPNLGPGPETREYRAVYLLNDQPIGNPSAIVSITVPGAATGPGPVTPA